jgi:hypothetical protein
VLKSAGSASIGRVPRRREPANRLQAKAANKDSAIGAANQGEFRKQK